MKIELPFVQPIRRNGKVRYTYYRRGGARQTIHGEPGSQEWFENYHRIHAMFEADRPAGPDRVVPGSLRDLVIQYQQSPNFRNLAEGSKVMYRRHMEALCEDKGNLLVKDMPREYVLRLRDQLSDKPAVAKMRIAVLRMMLQWAMDYPSRFGVKTNPADKVKNLTKTKVRPAWPIDLIEKMLTEAPPEIALAVRLGLDTGQRLNDCLTMTWSQVKDDGGIEVVQQKTGRLVWIPRTPELSKALDEAPRDAVQILVHPNGRPWNIRVFMRRLKSTIHEFGYEGYTFHGLRHAQTARLKEAGCSDLEIQSILGWQTSAMVAHYGQNAQQRLMAQSAMEKLSRTRSVKRSPDEV